MREMCIHLFCATPLPLQCSPVYSPFGASQLCDAPLILRSVDGPIGLFPHELTDFLCDFYRERPVRFGVNLRHIGVAVAQRHLSCLQTVYFTNFRSRGVS